MRIMSRHLPFDRQPLASIVPTGNYGIPSPLLQGEVSQEHGSCPGRAGGKESSQDVISFLIYFISIVAHLIDDQPGK